MQNVTLLHAPLPADGAWHWQPALLQALPYAKRLELERRQHAELRASLAGLALVVLGMARIRGTTVAVRQLLFTPGGKPRCDGGPYFSVSHSAARVACAISETVDPGVDIESVAAAISSARREQVRRWTATEAALKAAGLGLRDAARVRLDVTLDFAEIGSQRYALRELQIADGCICHVATAGATPALEIIAVGLDDPDTSLAVERSLGIATQLE